MVLTLTDPRGEQFRGPGAQCKSDAVIYSHTALSEAVQLATVDNNEGPHRPNGTSVRKKKIVLIGDSLFIGAHIRKQNLARTSETALETLTTIHHILS